MDILSLLAVIGYTVTIFPLVIPSEKIFRVKADNRHKPAKTVTVIVR